MWAVNAGRYTVDCVKEWRGDSPLQGGRSKERRESDERRRCSPNCLRSGAEANVERTWGGTTTLLRPQLRAAMYGQIHGKCAGTARSGSPRTHAAVPTTCGSHGSQLRSKVVRSRVYCIVYPQYPRNQTSVFGSVFGAFVSNKW